MVVNWKAAAVGLAVAAAVGTGFAAAPAAAASPGPSAAESIGVLTVQTFTGSGNATREPQAIFQARTNARKKAIAAGFDPDSQCEEGEPFVVQVTPTLFHANVTLTCDSSL